MNGREYRIIYYATKALAAVPHRRNPASSIGAAQYDEEMRKAISIFSKIVDSLYDDDLHAANQHAEELASYVDECQKNAGVMIPFRPRARSTPPPPRA